MNTGRLLVFEGTGKPLNATELKVRTLKDGEILIRNIYTTLCGSDLHTYCGKRNEKTPTVLGHEIVGTVQKFAETGVHQDFNGEALHIGDRVTWAVFAAYPQQQWLEKGMPQKSDKLFKYGHALVDGDDAFHGGLADFTILRPHTAVFKLPEDLPTPIAATINCAVATVAGAMRLAGDVRGKTVMITGLGLLGNLAAAMCKVEGAAKIIAVDVDQNRLEQAKRFGATDVFLNTGKDSCCESLSAYQIDVALEMSGATDAVELGIENLAIGGVAVWIGSVFKARKAQIDAEQVIRKLIIIKGLHNYNFEDLKAALTFMSKHHKDFPFSEIVEKEFPLNEAASAFDYAITHKPLRVGVYIEALK